MRGHSLSIGLIVVGISLFHPTISEGQLNIFKKAQPREENLDLAQNHGPWLIMCASFIGEAGEAQAQKLVAELRHNKFEAYVYRHSFDYSASIQSIPSIGYEPPPDMQGLPVPIQVSAAHVDKFEEIAVVVGNFASLDDKNAQQTLDKIKTLKPSSLTINEYTSTNQRMGTLRAMERISRGDTKGPMGSAFMMPNPLLPDDFFNTPEVDKVIMKLNKGIRYSLLDCPGNYSVKVATFKGDQTFNAGEIVRKQDEYQNQLKSGRPLTESKLADAGAKAHLLCTALRKMGEEAFEFHDYHESYVCVGSFDWAKRSTAAGEETNTEIALVIKKFKAQEVGQYGQKQMVPRTINILQDVDINFDAQPLPIIVPKATTSLGRGLFGR